ncbi:uncharacterized protein METZ01_LOCUS487417, partial [marine metagenome]
MDTSKNRMKAIKVTPAIFLCVLLPITVTAQDFSNFKYRNV